MLSLELSSLQVTGGASETYPAFAAGTHHYALTCASSTTLQVTAQAVRANARLTLLRADTTRNAVATHEGGVTVLANGNWLIFWGYPLDYTVAVDQLITISEVNRSDYSSWATRATPTTVSPSARRTMRTPTAAPRPVSRTSCWASLTACPWVVMHTRSSSG